MFDPGAGRARDPAAHGVRRAREPQESERKIEVRQDHGIAVHGPIVPKRSQLGVDANERQANEVVFGFVLPYHGDDARLLPADAERPRAGDADHRAEGRGPHASAVPASARARSASSAGTSTG